MQDRRFRSGYLQAVDFGALILIHFDNRGQPGDQQQNFHSLCHIEEFELAAMADRSNAKAGAVDKRNVAQRKQYLLLSTTRQIRESSRATCWHGRIR